MLDCYCVTCCLLKCAVIDELFEDKKWSKFEVVMIVRHFIYLVDESEQNEWKSTKYEKEWPKNEGKQLSVQIMDLVKI